MEKILLQDFKELSPFEFSIKGNIIIVKSLDEYNDINSVFAFCHICNKTGHDVLFQENNIVFTTAKYEEESKLAVIKHFIDIGKDTYPLPTKISKFVKRYNL